MKKQLLIILLLLITSVAKSTTYYVSSSGSDSNNGITSATPFLSIAKINSLVLVAGDQVLFKKGDTFYGSLVINKSGSLNNPITYGSYGTGNNPVITGFTTATGWTNEGGGVYSKIIASEDATNMVIINDVQYAIGRYPNNTFLTYESCDSNVSITDNELPSSPNWTGAEVVIKKNGFNIDRCLITNHSSNSLAYTNLGGTGNATAGYGYFIQNDIRTLDQYGEWYHDIKAGKFYMYFGAVDPTTKVVKVATLNNVIENNGYDYITIDGLSISGSILSAIDCLATSDNCTVKNCNIEFSGLDGIRITGSHGLIDNNIVSNCNVGGIAIGASGAINNTVTNNLISNCNLLDGQKKKNTVGFSFPCGILAAYGGCLIKYNKIENVGYNGMHLNGNNMLIKNNYINNCMLRLNDGGAIYTNSNHSNFIIDGNIITNLIGNIEGTTITEANLASDGADGIYLDELCNGVVVENNTITNCSGTGIKLHKANNNSLLNNTVFNSTRGILFLNFTSTNYLYGNTVTGNKFISKSATQLPLKYRSSCDEISTIGTLNNNYYSRSISESNQIYAYQPSLGTYQNYSLDQWKSFSSQDANSLASPITVSSVDDIYFYYNPTKNDSTVVLTQPGIDVTGQAYASPITLAPYSSIVILRDSSTGTYYYVSSSTGNDSNLGTQAFPWASLTKVNSATLVAKDRVLFKNGDSWYGQLVPKSGSALGDIIYSSYGTGANKPLIHASSIITGASNWTNYSSNIWKNINQSVEICNLVFNNDRSFGKRKWSIGTLASQGDWFWDSSGQILYLYSNGIPSDLYQHIRAVTKVNLISASSKSYITIDGLALKYGDYGFVGTNTDHVTIKNCDVAWIGGSQTTGEGRKGNGIEFWASNSNALVQTCNIWECFDAGITNQSSIDGTSQSGITYKNNKIWNCEYGYEYFNTGIGSSASNILLEYNIFENSGMGWGHSQRSNPSGYNLRLANRNEATHSNFVIRNNIFNVSVAESHHNWDTTYALYTIDYNYYYQPTANIAGINFTTYYSTAQFGSYKSATGWDAHSLALTPSTIVDLSVYRNDTNEQVVLPLVSPKVDLTGQKKVSSIVLPAYTPAFLMVDHNPAPTTNPTGKKKIFSINGKHLINTKTGKIYVK